MDFNLRLILAILTCYRLARLIAKDDGPLFLFKRIRYGVKDKAWLEAEKADKLVRTVQPTIIDDRHFGKWHSLAEGLECPYCLGVWLSLPLLTLIVWPSYYGDLFLMLMAMSGGQAWLWGMVKRE